MLAAAMVGMVAVALAFQYVARLEPCPLCQWQRLPHLLGAGLCLAAALRPRHRGNLLLCAAVTMVFGAGIALYHVGVERHWWEAACVVTKPFLGIDVAELTKALVEARASCVQSAWALFGISMAGWNGTVSAALAVACVHASSTGAAGTNP